MLKIYHKDGSVIADRSGRDVNVHSLTYSGEWMGECAVTTDIESAAPIDFAIGDTLTYRGETFTLNYDPGKTKQGRRDVVGNAFKYDAVKWSAQSDEMAQADFLDVVLASRNDLHYTALPSFSFYVDSIDDLLDRLQANMDEQTVAGKWKFYSRNWARSQQRGCTKARWEEVYGGKALDDGSQTGVEDNVITSTSISIQKQSVWEGLALVNSQFDVNFIVRNNEVFVGTAGLPTRNVFKYGKGNGLYEIEENADSDQKIVTRLRAYGSEKNLPTRYYSTLNMEVWMNGKNLLRGDNNGTYRVKVETDLGISGLSGYFRTVIDGRPGEYAVKVKVDGNELDGVMKESGLSFWQDSCMLQVDSSSTQSKETLTAMADAIGNGAKIYVVSGANKANFPDDHKAYTTENLPNNMACERLMLPGFPNESLADWWARQTVATKKRLNPTGAVLRFSGQKDRPWIESAEADTVGQKSGSVYFDTEDTKNKIDEIYPTLEEMTVGGVRVDEIYKGSEITDNGVFKEGQDIPGFTIELRPELDIDINELRGSYFTVVMKDGMCAGRPFKVGGSVKENGRWKLTMQRMEDGGLYYPYKDFQINAGDHFVLTGIEMPKQYVEAASEKLLQYAITWLLANDHTRKTYSPKVDEIFMARQHDEAMADTTNATRSLHDTLKEGDMMRIYDEDLGIDADVTIDSLTIKEEGGRIPTYEITLRDDKEVGTLQKIQEQITAIANGNGGGGGGGVTAAQVKEYVASEGGKYFLSKVKEDTAQKAITFKEGLKVGDVGKGIDGNGDAVLGDVVVDRVHDVNSTPSDRVVVGAQGFDLYLGEDGKSHLYIDYLVARVKAFFAQLEIRRVSYSGGTTIFSNAGSTIAKVMELKNGNDTVAYKCYAVADDGTTKTMNWWHVGMMALCQTFNVKSGTSNDVSNRYYWRLVVDTGQEVLADGKTYDYVVLSNVKEFDGNGTVHGDIRPLSALLEEYETTTTDDSKTPVASRRFYGYEAVNGGEPDAPAEGDVIVQVGDQIRWKSYGNVIKLATSTEDKATDKTTANAPSITMYYGVGAPRKVGTAVTPYVWQEVTCILSPGKVRINADMFELFSGSTGNVIEPYVVSYELVPTSRTLVKHDDGSTTPNHFGVDVVKRVGSSKTVLKADEYTVKADVTYENGGTETLSLADLYESVLRNLTALKLVACSAKDANNVLADYDIAVLSDGKKGADGEPGADGANGVDGEAGVDIYWTPNPLVIKTKTDSNGNVSAVLDENRAAQVMFFRDGINWGDDHIVDFFVYETRGCSALAQKQGNGLFVVIEGINSQEITTSDGKTITVPVTTASVTVAAKYWVTQSAFTHIYATLAVNVDVSAVWGGLKMDMSGLTSQYTEISRNYKDLSSKYDDLPLQTKQALTEYTSTIKQTAREISLKVSETAVGRKNLLVDSAFRKRNVLVTDTYNSGIQVLDNVGGVNSYCLEAVNPGEYPWISWCGDAGGNIKVEKGKTYTLSVWAKRDSSYANCYCEFYLHSTKTTKHDDSNRVSLQAHGFSFKANNVWELKTYTFAIPENATMEYLEVMLIFTPLTSKTSADNIHCWYCQPMLVEGDEYVGWSMSKEDAEYVGGNLLDNTDTLKTGGTLTVATENTGLHPTNGSADEIARQTYNGCATLNSDARYYSGNIDTVKWDLGDTGFVKQGQDYMFSFMAKGNKGERFTAYFYKSDTTEKVFVEVLDRVNGPNQHSAANGNAQVEFDKDYEWKQYWVHWRVVGGNLPKYVLIRCMQGCDLYVSQPKLEYGATVTEYTTSRSMSSRLLDAGIDINSKQITLTADKTVFRDQSGKETAVFKDGAINANLIKAKQAVIDTLRTESVEAGNLNVTGSSRFGIWAIEHDKNLGCDIITANDTTVGNVNISGSMIQYTPAFVRSGNPISGYMRTGAQVTEFGCGDGAGNYTGLWLGKSAYTVARGATNDWGLPTGYARPGATFGAAQLTAYVYSPFGGETPAVYLYKPQGGIVMETNAAIRGVFVNHVHDTGSDSGMGNSTGLVVAKNESYAITVSLPTQPIAGQQVTVIQKGGGKVYIKSNKKNIRTAGGTDVTQQRLSNSRGQISLFIYDGTDWNCTYITGRMSEY